MTDACLAWLRRVVAYMPDVRGDVLEVGSLNINGSPSEVFGERSRFPRYVGVDMRSGDGVGLVAKADALPVRDGAFAVVLSTEMLEHDDRFWLSLVEFARVLAPGGHAVLTTRGPHFPHHDFPCDYWRFTDHGLRAALEWAGFVDIDAVEDAEDKGVYAVARRGV